MLLTRLDQQSHPETQNLYIGDFLASENEIGCTDFVLDQNSNSCPSCFYQTYSYKKDLRKSLMKPSHDLLLNYKEPLVVMYSRLYI
jgi:uncharacterized protein YbbK (DUF523 family)